MPFYAIAAMSENRVIGNQGKIPWHLPEDFRWFKHKTMGGTLVMGRKTFESIGKPLPGRKTVVLSKGGYSAEGITVFSSIAELQLQVPQMPLWICGGAQIYHATMPQWYALYLTRVKRGVQGDTAFPEFEKEFQLTQTIHENADFRVERWEPRKAGHHPMPHEPWPFPLLEGQPPA